MSTKKTLFAFTVGLFAVTALGQNYSIGWSAIASVGGTSTGEVYSVSGTVAQPGAGTMNGAEYSLVGGSWEILNVIPTSVAPSLTIRVTSTNGIVISWPAPSTGFALQQNTTLNSFTWTKVTATPNQVGGEMQVVVNIPDANHFFRLQGP